MVTVTCPWCEADLRMDPAVRDEPEVRCADCMTSWLMADEPTETLALAA